jgi:hypothetical protein
MGVGGTGCLDRSYTEGFGDKISGVGGLATKAYFAKLGLFSLTTARAEAISPQRG